MDLHIHTQVAGDFPYHYLIDGALRINREHHIVDADDAFCRWVSMRKEELLGRSWPSLFHPFDRREIDNAIASLQQGHAIHRLLQGFVDRHGSDQIYLQLQSASDSSADYYCLFINLGERVNYTSSKRRYEKLFELSHDLLCVANTLGYFLQVNPTFTRVLGYTEAELLNKSFLELIHPDDVDATVNEIRKLRSGMDTLYFENRYQRKDGSWCWLAWSTPAPDTDGLLYAVAKDITERKELEQRLKSLSKYDAISGLPNRSYLDDELVRAMARARRNQHVLGGFIVQLPLLNEKRKAWGNDAVEELVLQFALRLRQQLRANDFVAHLDPATFVILSEAKTVDQLRQLETKLPNAAQLAFFWQEQHHAVVGRISPAYLYNGEVLNAQVWLQNAMADFQQSAS